MITTKLICILAVLAITWSMVAVIERVTQFSVHKVRHPELYADRLLFLEPTVDTKHYTAHGYNLARQRRIVITGLCRDCEKQVRKNVHIAQSIGRYFAGYKIVIYENDSEDSTRSILDGLADRDSNIIIIGEDAHEEKMYDLGSDSKERYDKMSLLRNQYLQYIKSHLDDYEYMLVMDWDLEGSTDMNGIMGSIGREYDTEWDAISTMGLGYVPGTLGSILMPYDLAAARFPENRYDKNCMVQIAKNIALQTYYSYRYPDMVPVSSAFYGMVLYKLDAVIKNNCVYGSEFNCEHVAFNLSLQKIYINSQWKTYAGWQGPTSFTTICYLVTAKGYQ